MARVSWNTRAGHSGISISQMARDTDSLLNSINSLAMDATPKFGTAHGFYSSAACPSITVAAPVMSLKALTGGLSSGNPKTVLGTLENKGLFIQGFYQEMRYFCDCILEGKPAEQGSLEFALEVMKVYEAGLRSEGETVPV